MASSVLIGIPYSISDWEYNLQLTLASIWHTLGKDVDVIVVTDEGVPPLYLPMPVDRYKPIFQANVVGHGVGKARNVAGMFAYKNKYDCLIFMDSHMIILSDDFLKICKSKLGQPRIVVAEARWSPVMTIDQYFMSMKINYDLFTLGSFLHKKTWQWAYIIATETRKTVMTTEPSFSISYDVIEALIQAQGKLTLADYWGKENFDMTVSAARLGYDMDIYPEVSIAHVYKDEKAPFWKIRFKSEDCKHEPYCGILQGSVYLNGIIWGDCVYALKHYDNIDDLPVNKDVCELVKEYDPDAMMRIKMFNEHAKYSLDDVYRRLDEYLKGGEYVWVEDKQDNKQSSPPQNN